MTDYIVGEMPKTFKKEDVVIRKAALRALKMARMYDTELAILKDGKAVFVAPDEFEKLLPEDIRN